MNDETIKQLANAFAITKSHFTLLHLGYFFEDLTRRINVSRLARDVHVRMPDNRIYQLKAALITDILQNIYDHPNDTPQLSHLILTSSLRQIAMSLASAFERTKLQDISELEAAYEDDIFAGNKQLTDSFTGIVRFLRNVLSHNIEDRLILQPADYLQQLEYRNSPKNKFGPIMRFEYDYNQPSSAIHIPGYSPSFRIELDLNRLSAGQTLDDAIPSHDAILLAEFCYYSLLWLNNKYVETVAS